MLPKCTTFGWRAELLLATPSRLVLDRRPLAVIKSSPQSLLYVLWPSRARTGDLLELFDADPEAQCVKNPADLAPRRQRSFAAHGDTITYSERAVADVVIIQPVVPCRLCRGMPAVSCLNPPDPLPPQFATWQAVPITA